MGKTTEEKLKLNAYLRKYRQRGYVKQREKEYMKKWREKNPEKRRKLDLNYYQKNSKARKQYQKEYRKKHLWVRNCQNWVWYHRVEVLAFLKNTNRCWVCGSKRSLQIHHKKYTLGFKDLFVLCSSCHQKVHRGEIDARKLYAL